MIGLAALPSDSRSEITVSSTAVAVTEADQTFYLRDTKGRAFSVESVKVEAITGPENTVIGEAAVDVKATSEGPALQAPFVLKLTETPAFEAPGEYAITIAARGTYQDRNEPEPVAFDRNVALTISRQAASPDLSHLKDAKIWISKEICCSGRSSFEFVVTAPPEDDLQQLELADYVLRDDHDVPADGTIRLAEESTGRTSCGADPDGAVGLVSGRGEATLCLTDFSRAGEYEADLRFTSPRLSKAETVPIKIAVKDHWLPAFAAIFGGVFLGFAVHHAAKTWRPRLVLRMRLLQLKRRIEALDDESKKKPLLGRVNDLLEFAEVGGIDEEAVKKLTNEVAALEQNRLWSDEDTTKQIDDLRKAIFRADLFLAIVALLVATAIVAQQLYIDKPFGTLDDYINAGLWGFGVDTATRGLAATLKKLTG